MRKREGWRQGFRLTKAQALGINNVLRAARHAKDRQLVRRLRGLLLVGVEGYTQESAGEIVEATASCVWRWCRLYRQGGVDALRTRKPPGRRAALTEDQRQRLRKWVLRGPEASGFDTGVWTAPMVRDIIRAKFGVNYHETHVRRVLHQLGFSVQYPKKILSEANLHKQKRWLNSDLPAIKKKRSRRAG